MTKSKIALAFLISIFVLVLIFPPTVQAAALRDLLVAQIANTLQILQLQLVALQQAVKVLDSGVEAVAPTPTSAPPTAISTPMPTQTLAPALTPQPTLPPSTITESTPLPSPVLPVFVLPTPPATRPFPTEPVPSPSSPFVFTRQLNPGDSGPDVWALQTLLNQLGFYPEAIFSGYLGPFTINALTKFQTTYNLPPAGRVGPLTLTVLNNFSQSVGSQIIATPIVTPVRPRPTRPTLTISVLATPIAQTVVSGTPQFHFATYKLDATQSDESLRMASIPLEYNVGGGGIATNLTSCQLYSGSMSVTTGTNVVNPSRAASSTVFTFDGSGIVITAGTTRNLDLKCNIAGGVTGKYAWGYDDSSTPSATGLTSGRPALIIENDNMGQIMTVIANGSYTVTDDSTPGYRIVNAGQTGVTLLRLRFRAFDEGVNIQRVAFQLSGVASNTPIDLVNSELKLYDEVSPTVLIGTAQFTANGDFATSSILANFSVPKGGSKTIIVKGDFNTIGVSGPLVRSGDLLKADYDGDANGVANGNYGIGISSGSIIAPTSADTSVDGVRIMKAHPIFAKLPVPSNLLRNGDNADSLYRFSVTATAGEVHIYKLTFNISSTTITGSGNSPTHATTSKYSLYAYTDPNFTILDTSAPGNGTLPGLINGGQCYGNNNGQFYSNNNLGIAGAADMEIIPFSGCSIGTTTYKIPANTTRYLDFRAQIQNVELSSSVQNSITIRLRGDSAFPVNHQCGIHNPGEMGAAGITSAASPNGGQCAGANSGVDVDSNDDFIWSPASTSSSPTIFDFDFTNGYQAPGLPANDMAPETFTSPN